MNNQKLSLAKHKLSDFFPINFNVHSSIAKKKKKKKIDHLDHSMLNKDESETKLKSWTLSDKCNKSHVQYWPASQEKQQNKIEIKKKNLSIFPIQTVCVCVFITDKESKKNCSKNNP